MHYMHMRAEEHLRFGFSFCFQLIALCAARFASLAISFKVHQLQLVPFASGDLRFCISTARFDN